MRESLKPVLVAAGLTAVGAAVVWALAAWLAGTLFGWGALLVGIAVGVAVGMAAPADKSVGGSVAAGVTIAGLLFGKIVILQLFVFSPPASIVKAASTDEFLEVAAYEFIVRPEGNVSPDLSRWMQDHGDFRAPAPDHVATERDALLEDVRARLEALNEDERSRLVRLMFERRYGEMPFGSRLRLVTNALDPIYTIVAAIIAWVIAGRGAKAGP
jgi:hypothetical protein